MKKILAIGLMIAAVFPCVLAGEKSNSKAKITVEQRIDSLMLDYDKAKNDTARLAVCLDVLEKYPESDYTVSLLSTVKSYSEELNRLDDFIPFAERLSKRIISPGIQVLVGRFLAGLYGELKDAGKLDAVAAKLEAAEQKNFMLFYDLIKAYTAVEKWQKVLELSENARFFATAESYKKDYPDREMTDKQIEEHGSNRRGLILTYAGWAKANSGNAKEALADFNKADGLMERTYLEYSDGELDYFWGRTLAGSGDSEKALDRLARKTLFGEDEASGKAMREAYVKMKGSNGGYDEYLSKRRAELAKTIDDFSLARYNGQKLSLSSFKGKVVLLSFWFPT